ncbi:MAG: hypothetical protein ACTSYC_02355 [Promethearchaeota archaeon]
MLLGRRIHFSNQLGSMVMGWSCTFQAFWIVKDFLLFNKIGT